MNEQAALTDGPLMPILGLFSSGLLSPLSSELNAVSRKIPGVGCKSSLISFDHALKESQMVMYMALSTSHTGLVMGVSAVHFTAFVSKFRLLCSRANNRRSNLRAFVTRLDDLEYYGGKLARSVMYAYIFLYWTQSSREASPGSENDRSYDHDGKYRSTASDGTRLN